MSLAPGRLSRSGILLAAILAALPFVPGLISGRTLYYRDVGQNHLPDRALGARMMREGQLPLWNPHRGNGQPFLANPNSMVLRPTTPLFLLLPARLAHVAYTLSVILLMGVAAAGTYALLRDTGHGAAAALVGAAAFSLSGAFQSMGQFANLLEGAAWIPVTLFLLNRAVVRGRHPWAVLAGVSLALVVSCGEPILAGVTLLGAAALPGFRTAARRDAAIACGVALLLAVLIASAQLLPLWNLASMSARSQGLPAGEALKWSLPPAAFLQAAIPSLWGDPARAAPTAYWGSGLFDTSLPFLPSIHLGLPVLLLAGAGLRRGGGRLLALGAAAGAALSLGRFLPLHGLVEGWVPGLAHTRYPVKWMLLVSWAVALLAARGFERLLGEDRSAPGRHLVLRIAGGILALLAALGAVVWWRAPTAAGSVVRSLLGVPSRITDGALAAGAVPAIGLGLAAGAAAGVALVWVTVWRGAAPRLRSAIAAAICVAALLPAVWGLNPTAPPGVVFARSPLLDRIPQGSWRDLRLFGFPRPPGFAFRSPSAVEARAAGLPADSLAWGMRWDNRSLRFVAPYLHGVMGAYDQGGESLLGLEPGATVARRLREGIEPAAAARLLRAASVGWVVAYGEPPVPDLDRAAGLPGESNIPLGLYHMETPVPRVSLRARAVEARSPGEAVSLVAAGRADPATDVVLEGVPPSSGAADDGAPESGGAGEAVLTEEKACEVRVHVRAARPAWLVLTDTWDPWWRSRIDGAPAPVLRADGMFRAVHVPAGDHEIDFTYRPMPVELGALGTLTGLVAAAGLLLAGRRAAGRDAA